MVLGSENDAGPGDHSASHTKSWAPAALGPGGSLTFRLPQRTGAEPSPQGLLLNDRMALSLRSSSFGLEFPLPAALTTHRVKLQVFLGQNFCKSLLLFIQKY